MIARWGARGRVEVGREGAQCEAARAWRLNMRFFEPPWALALQVLVEDADGAATELVAVDTAGGEDAAATAGDEVAAAAADEEAEEPPLAAGLVLSLEFEPGDAMFETGPPGNW